MINSFKSKVLQQLWQSGDVTLLPNTYVYQVIEILDDLDDATSVKDLELLGGFEISQSTPGYWAVTVTVNNVEPIGSVTCLFSNGNAYDVDLNEYKIATLGDEKKAEIFNKLRDMDVYFSDGREWCPSEVFEHLRDTGLLSGKFTMISWAAPSEFFITTDK